MDLEQGEIKRKKLEKGASSSSLPETSSNNPNKNNPNKKVVGRPPGKLPNSMMTGRATTVGVRNVV